ncbi:MAG: hypothetical protein V1749_08270 [Candidatus Desantisbacteria bacterium]
MAAIPEFRLSTFPQDISHNLSVTYQDIECQGKNEFKVKISVVIWLKFGMVQNCSPQGYRDTEKNNPLTPISKGELEKRAIHVPTHCVTLICTMPLF